MVTHLQPQAGLTTWLVPDPDFVEQEVGDGQERTMWHNWDEVPLHHRRVTPGRGGGISSSSSSVDPTTPGKKVGKKGLIARTMFPPASRRVETAPAICAALQVRFSYNP